MPYTQSFEPAFALGANVEFLTNWEGNEVQENSRIYQSAFSRSGTYALAAQATGSFRPEILLKINTEAVKGAELNFWLSAAQNGSGSRPAEVSIQYSADGGKSFADELFVAAMPNEPADYQQYNVALPTEVLGKPLVYIKWLVKRGASGSGTTALVLMDDVELVAADPPPPPKVTPFRSVVINEIFADPYPKGDVKPLPQVLPTESSAEWIELFNNSSETVDLNGWTINNRSIPSARFSAGSYLLLVPEDYAEQYRKYGEVVAMSSWSSLTNSGDEVVLRDAAGTIVDSLSYTKAWYGNSAKEEGGWSLEQIRPVLACSVSDNWQASEAALGATPGAINSVNNSDPDLKQPELLEAVWLSGNEVRLRFSEALSTTTQASQITVDNLAVQQLILQHKSIILQVEDLANSREGLLVSGSVEDCSGNVLSFDREIILPRPAEDTDLVLNEIMYDPTADGAEWVELYNTSGYYISLQNWYLAILDGGIEKSVVVTKDLELIAPGGFRVITSSPQVLKTDFPYIADADVIFQSDLFTFRNDGDTLALLNEEGLVVDKVFYNDDLHHPLVRQTKGVSLERINPYEYNNGGNWSSAQIISSAKLNAVNASPAKPNSQWIVKGTEGIGIEVVPKIIHPAPDGLNDLAIVRYQLPEPNLSGKIILLNASGTQEDVLLNNTILGKGGELKWTGTNSEGYALNSGYYIVLLQTFDANGNKKTYKATVVISN